MNTAENSTFLARIKRVIFTISLGLIISSTFTPGIVTKAILSPLAQHKKPAAEAQKPGYEVFGFAPYWTINKLDNVDFGTLTTLAYFGVPVNSDGTFDASDVGYKTLKSTQAQQVFERAHSAGARVVLTITQMDNDTIETFLADKGAQQKAISSALSLAQEEKLDGVNIDFEYVGNPGLAVRHEFSEFVSDFSSTFHNKIPNSYITVSVYAASMKDPKIYDIASLANSSDGIFMMAYDFATASSNAAVPTAPLYGYREGKYWYDISTAVQDFLKVMPANKLILGLPWYGYNYAVETPSTGTARYTGYYYTYYWRYRRYTAFYSVPSSAQTYSSVSQNVVPTQKGWDEVGKSNWYAYQEGGIWRMVFFDDPRSLKIKYDFAKSKNLAGVGIWALGFDSGTSDMWNLLSDEFGAKLADNVTSSN